VSFNVCIFPQLDCYSTFGMDTVLDRYLRKIYFKPKSPASFSSVDKLWKFIKTREDKPPKLTKTQVKRWLSHQDTASVFKRNRVRFPREKIVTDHLNELWEADLIDLSMLKSYNDGVAFVLLTIDVFSKKIALRPLLTKKATEVKNAFADIFSKGAIPERLRFDLGTEFNNKIVTAYLKSQGVHFYNSYSEKKSCFAERAIQTIKNKLFRKFYADQSYRYVDFLDDIQTSYNGTVHRTTGLPPAEITEENELEVYMKSYMPYVNKMAKKPVNFSFNVGDLVRVSYSKGKFSRSYQENYSEEIFQIKARIHGFVPRYELSDALGHQVKGSFYEEELQLVHPDENREFKIRAVLKYRKRKGKPREAKIAWYGYSNLHDSWIPAASVKKYKSVST